MYPVVLSQMLTSLCPVSYAGEGRPHWFGVCNEFGWLKTYESLDAKPALESRTGVAIVFGESHFISLLPLLVKMGIGLVCLADISWKQHRSNKAMLDTFKQSNDIDSFEKLFKANRDPKEARDEIYSFLSAKAWGDDELGKYHFLRNNERYQVCKTVLQTLTICQIQYDICDWRLSRAIATMIKGAGAQINLLNVSNIFSPRYDRANSMRSSVPFLLEHSKNANVLYSDTVCYWTSLHVSLDQFIDFMTTQARMAVVDQNDLKAQESLNNAIASFQNTNPEDFVSKLNALEDAIIFYENIFKDIPSLNYDTEKVQQARSLISTLSTVAATHVRSYQLASPENQAQVAANPAAKKLKL